MTFVRSSSDPLIRIACLVVGLIVGLIVWLIWSALRKVLTGEASPPQSAKSFRFSEMAPGPNDSHVRTIRTKIRGVSHRNSDGAYRQQIIRSFCHAGDALLLLREPGNPADSNAIGVIRVCRGADDRTAFGEQLGYLSKELARDLAPIFDEGPVGFAEILEVTEELTGLDDSCVGVNIRAEIYVPDG